jgi:TonB family protein
MIWSIALALSGAAQAQVAEVNNWTVYQGNGYCAAATTYGRDLNVMVFHDRADDLATLLLTRPGWRAVEPGRSYSVRVDFSNERYYAAPPAEGVILGEGNERAAGLSISLKGMEFTEDFASASWMEVRLAGTLIASLRLNGTRDVMRQVRACSARAFREDTRDPFETVAPSAPTAAPATSGPPRLIGGSISEADYPASALRAGAAGTTGVSIQIGADGRVTGCSVTRSSGNGALDATTCALVQRRFRFQPATQNGRPVASTTSRAMVWSLPENGPAVAPVSAAPSAPENRVAQATPRPAPGSRVWVQLGVAPSSAGFSYELGRMRRAAPELLADRGAYTAAIGSSRRLLVGPFATASDARQFIEGLRAKNMQGLVWLSPAGEPVEPFGGAR